MTNFLYTRNTNSGISKNTFECIKIKTNCNKDMLLFKKFCDTRTYKGTDISYSYMWCIRPNRNSISRIEKVGHTWLIQERKDENISATGLHFSKTLINQSAFSVCTVNFKNILKLKILTESVIIRESIIHKTISLTQVVFPLSPLQMVQQLPRTNSGKVLP